MTQANRLRVVAIVGISIAAAPAFAAGGEAGAPWREFLWESFNLALLLAAIIYFTRTPTKMFFSARRKQIRDELSSAAEVLADAEARFAQWQEKMSELDAELEKIRSMELRRVEQERHRILEEAQEIAERIKRDAVAAVEREQRRAQVALQKEAGELAVDMAAGILREQMANDDRVRLVDEFIARVEAANPATRAER